MVEAKQDDNSASIEEENAELAVPDVELLAFQKQRSTPKVSLSEIRDDGHEDKLLELDNFADCADKGENYYGMQQAGGEDKIIS